MIAIFTAQIAMGYDNLMNYLQTLFGFFNAPLFATFILGMFWKRMTPTAGWVGLVSGTLSAVAVVRPGGGRRHRPAGSGCGLRRRVAAFVVDIVLSIVVSLVTKPKPASELKGLVYSETPREDRIDPEEAACPWYRRTVPLAGISLVMVIILNFAF